MKTDAPVTETMNITERKENMMEKGKKTLEELMGMTHEELISLVGKLQDELEDARSARDSFAEIVASYTMKSRVVKDMLRSVSGMVESYL